jgi:hypothetical protein
MVSTTGVVGGSAVGRQPDLFALQGGCYRGWRGDLGADATLLV